MGNISSALERYKLGHYGSLPDSYTEPKFDPLFGFPKGRKIRKMIATEEEMDSAKLKYKDRDYCAHHRIKLEACKRDNFPFLNQCNYYRHQLFDCGYEDALLRMKEYEREKRLEARQRRIKLAQQKEMLANK